MTGNQHSMANPDLRALSSILGVSLIALLTLFLLDAAIFRCPAYLRSLEPDSAAGTLQRALYNARYRPLTAPNRVLLFGDSQMAEGFSSNLAEKATGPDWQFINTAVPGATPRVWFYMLQDIDPNKNRFNVIVLPIPDYEDLDVPISYQGDYWDNDADRELDAYWLAADLRLKDVLTFPWSFKSWHRKFRVLTETLFKGLLLRRDFREFLGSPAARLAKARNARAYDAELHDYPGNPGSLEGMHIEWNPRRIILPPNLSPGVADAVYQRYDQQPEALGYMTGYRERWLGAILNYYRNKPVTFVIFRMPQRPVPLPEHWPIPRDAFIYSPETHKRTIVLDEHLFDSFENPSDFFDARHLNKRGRQAFSPKLALAIRDSAGNHREEHSH